MGIELKIIKSDLAKHFENSLKTLKNKVGKVGWFEKSKYPPEKVIENGKHVYSFFPVSVAEVAATQEFGYPDRKIPARPFMRPTIERQSNNWKKIALIESKKIIKGTSTIEKMMELIGQNARSEIQKSIKQVYSPPLAYSTIQARRHKYLNDEELSEKTIKSRKRRIKKSIPPALEKPLIDTGLMLATVVNTVEEE